MTTFNRIIRHIRVSETDQGSGYFEDLATVVLVGFLSVVTLIVLI